LCHGKGGFVTLGPLYLAGLLRTSGNRPSRRAADGCHELAPAQLVELRSRSESDLLTAGQRNDAQRKSRLRLPDQV
jgi:hypothetical protein